MDNSLNQNNKDKEKRQYQRHIKSLSIRLSVPDYPNATSIMLKGIEATALDVSKGGMYTHLNIPEKEFLNQLMSHSHLITLEIRLAENDKIIKLQALHMSPGNPARSPAKLERIPTRWTIHMEHISGKIEIPMQFRLHRLCINLF